MALAGLLAVESPAAAPVGTIENQYLRVSVDSGTGQIAVLDKAARHEWKQPQPAPAGHGFRDLKQAPDKRSLSFAADLAGGGRKTWPATITLSLAANGPDMTAEVDMSDRGVQLDYVASLEPFVLDTPSAALAVADYADGHLYPLNLKPMPKSRLQLDNIDMPWVGSPGLWSGASPGWAAIVGSVRITSIGCKRPRRYSTSLDFHAKFRINVLRTCRCCKTDLFPPDQNCLKMLGAYLA